MADLSSGARIATKTDTRRRRLEVLRSQMEFEHSSFDQHYRELGEYFLPRRPRFEITDSNRGERRNGKIIDSTPLFAVRTLVSGMMSGITSPARPWFRLTTPDPALAEIPQVKQWLHLVTRRLQTTFLRSNTYNSLPILYKDLSVFATGAIFIEEDFDKVLHTYSIPVGSYYILVNSKGRIDHFYREFRMTVQQVVDTFAEKDEKGKVTRWDNISSHTEKMYKAGQRSVWVDVSHFVLPNDQYDPNKAESKFKKFASLYYERGIQGNSGGKTDFVAVDEDIFLRESGYDFFPVLAPRWEVTGEDIYGTDCPGMTILGDSKQLQLGEKRGLQGLEKNVNPPLVGPTSLKKSKASVLPGDITYTDTPQGLEGFRPIYQVDFRLDQLEAKQQQVRQRISRAFYEDLFLMLAQSDRRQITAREIEERHEEKLLALGPVLERLNQELLDPLIDIAFEMNLRQGFIPEAPEELQGRELKVEYISIMAQAQKLAGLSGLERFTGYVGNLAPVQPDIIDKVNMDEMVDTYGDIIGLQPGIIRTDEEVAQIRGQRQAAAQAQQQAETARQAAGAAKDLSQVDVDGNNPVAELVRQARGQ